MKIYEIKDSLRKALESMEVDEETGELLGYEAVQNVQTEAAEKIEGCALFVRETEAEAKALAEEIARLTARKRGLERRCDWLKAYMLPALLALGGKVKTPRVTVSKMKTTRCVVEVDPGVLPEEFRRVKVEANLAAIKNALKGGGVIPGAHLEDRDTLTIRV